MSETPASSAAPVRSSLAPWRNAVLFSTYLASGLPIVALVFLVALLLKVKLALGFFPYSPFTERDGWLPSELRDDATFVFLVMFVAIPFALATPVMIGLQWKLRYFRSYRVPLVGLVASGLLLYLLLANPGGWTD